MNEMLQQIVTEAGANVLFGMIVIGIFAVLLVLVMFAALAVRALWIWLTGESVNSVIVKTARKALR